MALSEQRKHELRADVEAGRFMERLVNSTEFVAVMDDRRGFYSTELLAPGGYDPNTLIKAKAKLEAIEELVSDLYGVIGKGEAAQRTLEDDEEPEPRGAI